MKWITGLVLLVAVEIRAQSDSPAGNPAPALSFRQLQAWAYPGTSKIRLARFISFPQHPGHYLLVPETAQPVSSPPAGIYPGYPSNVAVGLQWTSETLPFFCRIEHDLGKKNRVPFKFRLGSVEYVDWLEGKPGCGDFAPYR